MSHTPRTKRVRHNLPLPFPVSNGELIVGGTRLSILAARVGQTPFYAYDRNLITSRITDLRTRLSGQVELHYAIKANPMPALVSHVARLVDGFDVASGGELRVALDGGMSASHISFAGPGKTEQELTQAVAANILINIESFREVELLCRISEKLGCAARVAVRVNPDFELKSSGMKMGGGAKPFGVDAEAVPRLLAAIREHALNFEGFHIFSGSQNLRADAIIEAQSQSYELALRLATHAPSPVLSLNLGGGFGIPYFPGDTPLATQTVVDKLLDLAGKAKREIPTAKLAIELGRYLVGEAGIYVCKVLDRKESRDHIFLITNGGLHHHLAASGNFGQLIRKNYPAIIGNKADADTQEEVTVVGPLCTPLDVLADKMELAPAEPGDLFVIFQSGAYGATASPQSFLGHPDVVEVLV